MTMISRREILTGAAAAAGAMLIHNIAKAADDDAAKSDGNKPFTFALMSDTHLGRNGEGPAKQMKHAVEEINASPAELIIFTGDLVNAGEVDANEKHYPEWLDIAGGWKKPWHAVPGNHDPVAKFVKRIGVETDRIVDVPSAPYRFVFFRDALPNPEHQGAVLDEQLNWLQAQIDGAAHDNRRVFLVSHIIYHKNEKPDVGWMIRDNREAFTDFLKQNAKQVDAFFAGHFHSGLRGWDDTFGIHEIVLPSACWNFDGKRLRGAPGYTFDEDRPGWVLAEVRGPGQIKLSYKPIGADVSVVKELTRAANA
jgi:3',5'-cyclic AMP phosphodiesterase CpdA